MTTGSWPQIPSFCQRPRWALLLAVVCLWAAAAQASGGGEPEMFKLRDIGETVPDMTLYDLAGKGYTLAEELRAGPILLFFWSVYCPNCKEVMPDLVELYRSREPVGLNVWAINVDGERFSNGVRAYVADAELPFPVLYDRLEGEYLVAADPLGVSRTPTLYLAGSDGRIVARQVIQLDFDALRTTLATLPSGAQ